MQCGICFENFDHSKRKPFAMIPCTHTLCIECINKLNEKICPICNKPFTDKNPNWYLLDLVPESSYDSLKKKLEQSLNDFKVNIDQLEHERFKLIEAQILTHTNEIIKSVHVCQSNLLSQLNTIMLERVKESLSIDQDIAELRDHLNTNDLNEDQINRTILKYSNLRLFQDRVVFELNSESIKLDSGFIGKLLKTKEPEQLKFSEINFDEENNEPVECKTLLEKNDYTLALLSYCDDAKKYKDDTVLNDHQSILNEEFRKPNKIDYFMSKGEALLDKKDNKGALKSFEKALKLDPNNALALDRKGFALTELNDHKAAIECFDKAIQLDSDQADFFNNKGVCLEALKRFNEALICYNQAIELDSHQAEYYANKGQVLMELKKYEESVISYDKAIELDPNDDVTYEGKGDVLMKMNRYSEAIKCFEKCIELDSEDAEYFSKKGSALLKLGYKQANQYRQGTYKQAIQFFNIASSLSPNNPAYLIRKGEALLHVLDFKETLNCCNKAIELEPLSHMAHNLKGIALFNLSDSISAIESLNKAIEIEPTFESYHYNKGVVNHKMGNELEAVEHFKEASRLNHSLNIYYPYVNSTVFLIKNRNEIAYFLHF